MKFLGLNGTKYVSLHIMTGSGSLLEFSDLSEFKFKCVSVWDQSIFMKIQGGISLIIIQLFLPLLLVGLRVISSGTISMHGLNTLESINLPPAELSYKIYFNPSTTYWIYSNQSRDPIQ